MPARIVVLGGGVGGTLTANLLSRELGRDAHVTVVDPTGMHVYQPGFLYLALGQANGLLLPGYEQTYFAKSLIPGSDETELTGRYLLRVYHKGSVVCKAKVDVAWGADDAHAEPFLAMKAQDA